MQNVGFAVKKVIKQSLGFPIKKALKLNGNC